jgi:oxygen-independent coproporphyrinogen-3 oxidase
MKLQEHFAVLVETLEANDFIHMNCHFGKSTIFQRIIRVLVGKIPWIGPSAHSYDGVSRSWNVSNNAIYLKSIQEK